MTRLYNDPKAFAVEMLDGLIGANPHLLRSAPGGAVRSTVTPQGKVAVVIGGGSGHYPAFAGLVGPGLADAAVVGDVFASPSTTQVVQVARAAERGAGVLLTFGNYAGDVLNFQAAAGRLRDHGVDAHIVTVTDDVASAPVGEESSRRGIAGDLVVFKIASAAAERGDDLEQVAEIARRANAATMTLGVAFAGCTLPGDDHPLFTVTPGHMAVGLGIHGEPGLYEVPFEDAAGLARLLVQRLLGEAPAGRRRAVALLNGLGDTKYEELFVLWRSVAALLAEAEVAVADVQVGELCTSLDMAGCSLTLAWLDDELLELWLADAESPAFRAGHPRPQPHDPDPVRDVPAEVRAIGPATDAGRAFAADVAGAFERVADDLAAAAERLGALDAVAGDGDHGRGMERGSAAAATAARDAVARGAGARTTIGAAADAWADRAGGTSGALWGVALLAASQELSDDDGFDPASLFAAVTAGRDAVARAGGAEPGDKTMLDAMSPFAEALAAAVVAETWRDAWDRAASAAEAAASATADVPARRGRSRVLGDKSIGTPDPGAVSFGIVVRAMVRTTATADAAQGDDQAQADEEEQP